LSNPGEADATPIVSLAQLAADLEAGCKPPAAFRIGTEHEKFGFAPFDLHPPPYSPRGIQAVLEGLQSEHFSPILDHDCLIGLKGSGPDEGASISLEPGGQLELSGAPVADLHQTKAEFIRHFNALRPVADRLGLGFAPVGFHPTARRDEMPWMPKSRYAIMRRYMPKVGKLGLDMMLRTCTVQVNLDFSSEADMVDKFRVGLMLQPLATALFANSPFEEGYPSGFLSTRAHIWTDTDNARSGIPAVVFEDGFGFERYVDWALNVPMYFVARDGRLIDLAGKSFRDHMAGKIDPALGPATMGDFADHLTTLFPDVRLKRFLEMRGADAGSPPMMLAQSAFWTGLLYDAAMLQSVVAHLRSHSWHEYAALRPLVPKQGLAAKFGRGTLRDLARDAVALSYQGLAARGLGEEAYLEPLFEIAGGGPTQAEAWLQRSAREMLPGSKI